MSLFYKNLNICISLFVISFKKYSKAYFICTRVVLIYTIILVKCS